MDFGIKAALLTGLRVIADVSRGTGRTTWVMDNALAIARDNPDHRCLIVTGSLEEGERIRRAILRAQRAHEPLAALAISVASATSREELERLILGGPPIPFVLDHFVIERLYEEAITRTSTSIETLRARAFPSGPAGYLPTDPFGRALYAFSDREDRRGPVFLRSEPRRR